MAEKKYGVVLRHLPSANPAISTVVHISDKEHEEMSSDANSVHNWERHVLLEKARDHMNAFKQHFVEFSSASWRLVILSVNDTNPRQIPSQLSDEEL